MLKRNIIDTIGSTPTIVLSRYREKAELKSDIYAKLEYFNPGGSVKDRVAMRMIKDYFNKGLLSDGSVIIEPTSGNTGVGIAMIAACLNLKAVIVMPESMSDERKKLITSYGARLVLTPAAGGMKSAIAAAEQIHRETPGSVIAGQFHNPSNPAAHYDTTGPEIWMDMEESIDIFVAGVGTGGTISGIGKYLKEKKPSIEVVAVEPADSPVISGGKAGPHKLQGIGAGFVPENLDLSVINRIVTVTTEEAYTAARLLSSTEGILVGISSGAALHAASCEAKKTGKRIATLFPDGGERYLSTDLYNK